jgi:aminoglycoside phosphotransferase (APT) family kinase protein
MMPTGDLGFMTRDEIVGRYAQKSGRASEELAHTIPFYQALGLFRLTVIIAQIYIRYHRGQTQDQRFAAFGPMIPVMAQAAQEVMSRAGGG